MRNSSRLSIFTPLLCALAITACQPQDPEQPVKEPAPAQVAAPQESEELLTVSQEATDPAGPNYIILGGSYVDLLGEDGEPDNLAGRLINGGTGVSAGSANENVWLLLGPTGKLTYLDEDGRPLRGDLLDVLEGNGVLFSSLGERRIQTGDIQSAWLIGGEDGRVQLVNQDGEPEITLKNQIYTDGSRVTVGGYSKAAEQWLVGSDQGQLTGLDATLTSISNSAVSGTPIAAIVGNPSVDAPANAQWVVASGDQVAYHPAGASFTFDGETFTTLTEANGQLVAGTESGRVAIWPFDALDDSPTWVDALEGNRVESVFWNGTDWLVLGDGGNARLVAGSDGSLKGDLTVLGDGSTLVSARWAKDRWLIATSSSLVLEASNALELLVNYDEPLDGSEVYDAAPGQELVVVAGEGGKYTTLAKHGSALGAVNTLAGTDALYAASWSGSTFLVGGEGGRAQVLDNDGTPQGDPLTLLDGKDIRAISWSGNVWLVAGAEGAVQRIRPNGETVGGVNTIPGFERINAARWSGDEWLVAGTDQGAGKVHRVKSDATAEGNLITLNPITEIHAVEWSGREWIVGGTGGLVQVISAAGEPRTQPGPQPRDVLNGATIHSIDFHANKYLVAGENGLTRLITQDLLTSAPPVAVAGFETIYEARWTLARGYGRGECLTNEACYVGSCIGDLQDGFCCDLACDRPCESCLESETGGVDGICSPLPADSEALDAGCDAEDASTCGQTGLCDGAGECALHGPDVVCSEPSCTDGDVTPESLCDGAGTCVTPDAVACAPYLTCDGADCGTTCTVNSDCVEGYECVEGNCQEEMEEMEPEPTPEPPPEEGCCAVVAPRHETPSKWGLLGLFGLILLRRRRRS